MVRIGCEVCDNTTAIGSIGIGRERPYYFFGLLRAFEYPVGVQGTLTCSVDLGDQTDLGI